MFLSYHGIRPLMDEKYSFALRKLALLGAMDDYIAISSRELGEALEMSQQSASKRILELLEEKYIVRDLGARRQRIKLTQKGIDDLRKEYNEYRRIFELTDHITIHGAVQSGMGEGARFSDHFSIPVCDIRSDVISAPLSLTSSRGHSHPAAAQNPREGAPARSASVIVSSAAILQTAVIRYAPFGDVPRLGAAAWGAVCIIAVYRRGGKAVKRSCAAAFCAGRLYDVP